MNFSRFSSLDLFLYWLESSYIFWLNHRIIHKMYWFHWKKKALHLFFRRKIYNLILTKILNKRSNFWMIFINYWVEISVLLFFIKLLPKHYLLSDQGNCRNIKIMVRYLFFWVKVKMFLLMKIHKGWKKQQTKNHFIKKIFFVFIFYLCKLFFNCLLKLLHHKLYLFWDFIITYVKYWNYFIRSCLWVWQIFSIAFFCLSVFFSKQATRVSNLG